MFGGSIHTALVHAATQYDIRQSKGKRYNPYAMAQYLLRIDEVEADIAAGAKPRAALCAAFSGQLLDVMLHAIDEQKHSENEKTTSWTYRPASR